MNVKNHRKIGQMVDMAKAHNSQAFADLYRETYQSLYFVALSVLKNEQDAQDAVQETYIKILSSLDSLKDSKLFVAWSNRIIYNISLRMLEKKRDIPMESETLDAEENEKAVDPLAQTVKNDQRRILLSCIEELDPILRTTIILKYYQDLKLSDIAQIMDCPEGTVKSRLNAARKQLHSQLKSAHIGNVLMGMVGILPLKGALLEAAGTVGISAQASTSSLSTILGLKGMSTSIGFTPVSSAAVGHSAGIATTVAGVSSIGAVGVVSTAVVVSSLAAPVINQVSLLDNSDYIAAPATLVVDVENYKKISEVYAVSENGKKYPSTSQDGNTFQIEVSENGSGTVYVSGKNDKVSTSEFAVNSIDNEPPQVKKYDNTRTQLELAFADTGAGTDYDSIYGVFPDGSQIRPSAIDKDKQKAIFALPKSDFTLSVSDLVGNQSKYNVAITTE